MHSPLIIAHRGASCDAPENTLAAFELAWRQGANGIEGDFRLTRDGAIVCLHDENTARVGNRTLDVAKSSLAELHSVDVGAWKGEAWRGSRIPTLAGVLTTVPRGGHIYLEVKCGPALIAPLARTLAAVEGRAIQATIISFDACAVAEAKRLLPAIKVLWLTGLDVDTATGEWTPSAANILATLERTGADGVDIYAHPSLNQAFSDALRARGHEFHAWVVNDPIAAARLAALGAASITTDRPGLLGARRTVPLSSTSPRPVPSQSPRNRPSTS